MNKTFKTKILKIDEIYTDEKLYPRMSINYETYSKYIDAIKSGAKFPSIKVAKTKHGYVLIDGRHRLKALADLKNKYVSAEVYEGLSTKEIYQMSIEANATHGKPFESEELKIIIRRLDSEFKMSREEISTITRIPMDKIKGFIVKEIIRDIPDNPSVKRKSIYQGIIYDEGSNLSKWSEQIDDDENKVPKLIQNKENETKSQLKIIEMLITLLKTNAISIRDETINYQLEKLYKLLKKRYKDE